MAGEDAIEHTPMASGVPVARMAALHGTVALALLALFAVADTWSLATGIALASLFSVLAGLLAGALLTTLVHEWSHFLGARLCRGHYRRVARVGLFAFDWDFRANSTGQFRVMSAAGNLGSIAAVCLFTATLPADTGGRVALYAAAWGSLVFTAAIEWPVLYRVMRGATPLAALGRIDRQVLLRSASAGAVTIPLVAWVLAP